MGTSLCAQQRNTDRNSHRRRGPSPTANDHHNLPQHHHRHRRPAHDSRGQPSRDGGERAGVRDANENADDADKIDGDKVTLIQRAVPGVSAADFTVEIDRKNTLTARADASTRFGRRRYSFSVALPKNVDKATVAAEVVNGCTRGPGGQRFLTKKTFVVRSGTAG